MSRTKSRKLADLISSGTFDDGVVAASEVTGLATVATSGSFNDLVNQPAAFDPATLASVAISGSFNDLSNQPTPQTAAHLLTEVKTVDGSGSGLDADLLDGVHASSFLRSDASDTMNGDLSFAAGANVHRNSHSSGYLVGSYNSVGGNSGKTNPIYTIGSAYQPTDTDLSDMYGIGYTHSDAAFDGINTVLAGWGMYVATNGTARVGLSGETGRIYGASLVVTGNVTAYYSDMRLKTKTRDVESALDKVSSLSGFYYVENDLAKELGYDNDKEQIALSAQEVQAVLPEAVGLAAIDMETNKEGKVSSKSGENYLTVDYARLVPLLVEAIKELNAKVEKLEGAK